MKLKTSSLIGNMTHNLVVEASYWVDLGNLNIELKHKDDDMTHIS